MKRATTDPHTYRREVEDRMQHMPLAKDRERPHWSAILAFVAWLGAYATGGLSFVVVALVMSLIAAVQFRQSRRGM